MRQHERSSCRTVPRSNFRVKYRLLVVGGRTGVDSKEDDHNHCQYYEENTNCWESLTDLPDFVERLYSVCHIDVCLVTGGSKKGMAMDQCWPTIKQII